MIDRSRRPQNHAQIQWRTGRKRDRSDGQRREIHVRRRESRDRDSARRIERALAVENNAEHELETLTDGRGHTTTIKYNGSHQVVLEKDPLSRELSFSYEPLHTVITNKATGAITDEQFASTGEPVAITRGFETESATTESFSYNPEGLPLSITDGNGHITKYTYDGEANRTSMVDPDEDETKWTYDTTTRRFPPRRRPRARPRRSNATNTAMRPKSPVLLRKARRKRPNTPTTRTETSKASKTLSNGPGNTNMYAHLGLVKRNRSRKRKAHLEIQRRLPADLKCGSPWQRRRRRTVPIHDDDRTRRPRTAAEADRTSGRIRLLHLDPVLRKPRNQLRRSKCRGC